MESENGVSSYCSSDQYELTPFSCHFLAFRWAWILRKQLPAFKKWSAANRVINVQKLLEGGYE